VSWSFAFQNAFLRYTLLYSHFKKEGTFMKRVFIGLTLVALPVVLSACGGDNSPTSSTQDAATSAAFSAIKGAVDQVNQTNVNSFTTEARQEALDSSAPFHKPRHTKTINAMVNCSDGGTATFTGTLTGSTTGSDPSTTDMIYTYTVALNDCVGLGSDGNSYAISSPGVTTAGNSVWQVSGFGTANMTFDDSDNANITGTLNVSGSESLTCDINVTEQFQSTSTIASGTTTITGSGSITGSACGTDYNAAVTISGGTPNQRRFAFN
jgi:hypothetical protein